MTQQAHSDGAPAIIATSTALPRHHYRQDDLIELAQRVLPDLNVEPRLLRRFFQRVGVEERYLALPAEAYGRLGGLEQRSRGWLEVGLDLGEQCLRDLFATSGIAPGDVGELMTTTVTGLCVPTLDARLMNRFDFAADTRRVPIFGLGCVGGAAGVARVAEYLRANPRDAAILLAVELCSLTLQSQDMSAANVISMGLFGDGAAAVLMVGADHPAAGKGRPDVIGSRSVFFPDTEGLMGWDMVDSGFKVVLDASIPEVARAGLPDAVDGFLDDHGLSRLDIDAWVTHPGGPAIMDAMGESLGLSERQIAPARRGLAEVGNLSSASVLFLLDHYRTAVRPAPGAHGLMLAMGPAFCAELVLLRW